MVLSIRLVVHVKLVLNVKDKFLQVVNVNVLFALNLLVDLRT